MRCFSCHSTGKLSLGPDYERRPAELGVRCESCHGPDKAHVAAAGRADTAAIRSSLVNPGRMGPGGQVKFRGSRHRPPASGNEAIDWRDPWNVRHQPIYLSQSRCFQESRNPISGHSKSANKVAAESLNCVTCHDPHQLVLRNDPAYYNERCAGCLSAALRPPNPETCRVNEGARCGSCHMPSVRPNDHLSFKNHWIGIYTDGEVIAAASIAVGLAADGR
jgi:hypothetical protein